MKTLKKRNPLSILAPRNMSNITKAQMLKVADDAIKAAKAAAKITDDKQDELMTLSRGEIMDAAEELVAEVVESLAVFVKAEGAEDKSAGADKATDDTSETTEVTEEVKEASEDEDTTGTEEVAATEEVVATEETAEEVVAVEEETVVDETKETTEEVVAEKSQTSSETSAIVDAIKALGATIQKSNEDTVAEIKKSNKAVADRVDQFAKKAGASAQTDDNQVVEEEAENSTTRKTAFAKNDPWGKQIA